MTRADRILTIYSLIACSLLAAVLVRAAVAVRATHPAIALELLGVVVVLGVLGVGGSMWSNALRARERAERCREAQSKGAESAYDVATRVALQVLTENREGAAAVQVAPRIVRARQASSD